MSVACCQSPMEPAPAWAGRKPAKRLGGMAEALSIAADLGFPPPEDLQVTSPTDKNDDLVKVLRELTAVQRSISNLQVELQGRKDDKSVAHLTHVTEMEKKCNSLGKITSILKDVIQNKDRIISRLQQPYSLDCIPVEAEYQKQFSELLLKAASDYGALTASVADFQWSQNFREPPQVWGEMLRPIPAALASCTRYFEAMSAMRDSFGTLQQLRVGNSSLPAKPNVTNSEDFLTPHQWKDGTGPDGNDGDIWRRPERESRIGDESESGDGINLRRLSWPHPSSKGF